MNHEDYEKAELIKKAVKLVDELAESDLGDIDGDFTSNDFDFEMLQKLIIKARKLKRSTFWRL